MINEELDQLFPTKDYKNLQVIAEPGRYFSMSAFSLVTNIIGKRCLLSNPVGVPDYNRQSRFRFFNKFEANEFLRQNPIKSIGGWVELFL